MTISKGILKLRMPTYTPNSVQSMSVLSCFEADDTLAKLCVAALDRFKTNFQCLEQRHKILKVLYVDALQ